MDKIVNDIREALEIHVKRHGPSMVYSATVKALTAHDTLTVGLDTGLEVPDVRLRSIVSSGNKIVMIPKVGSVVQIVAIENSWEFIVIAVEEITGFKTVIDTVEFSVDNSKLGLKKGTDSLAKLFGELIDEVNKIVVLMGTSPNVAALTAIKTRFNQMFE